MERIASLHPLVSEIGIVVFKVQGGDLFLLDLHQFYWYATQNVSQFLRVKFLAEDTVLYLRKWAVDVALLESMQSKRHYEYRAIRTVQSLEEKLYQANILPIEISAQWYKVNWRKLKDKFEHWEPKIAVTNSIWEAFRMGITWINSKYKIKRVKIAFDTQQQFLEKVIYRSGVEYSPGSSESS